MEQLIFPFINEKDFKIKKKKIKKKQCCGKFDTGFFQPSREEAKEYLEGV